MSKYVDREIAKYQAKGVDTSNPHPSDGSGWICEMIATFYSPELSLDRTELALDVNYCFQSFCGLRKLPKPVVALDFSDRSTVRANDPKALQFLWSNARRLYWLVYDVAPKFWQQQFTQRSALAGLLVRMIAAIVSVNPGKTVSSQVLIASIDRFSTQEVKT